MRTIAWKRIGSAPTDGTRILLYCTHPKQIHDGYRRLWEYLDWEEIDENTQTRTKACKDDEWCRWGTKMPITWPPTHWAPFVDIFPDDAQ